MSVETERELTEAARATSPVVLDAAIRVLRVASDRMQEAFVVRALNALAQLSTELDESTMSAVPAASSDYSALARALEQAASLAVLRHEDPLAAARLRGLRDRERLLRAEGGTLSGSEMAAALGITRQAVDQRRRRGRILGLTFGRRGYRYPSWQLGEEGIQPGLDVVLADLDANDHDPWMRLAFLLNPNSRLDGETPLATLRRGDVDQVRRAARMYGEHGAA